jgi:hypothetical protein
MQGITENVEKIEDGKWKSGKVEFKFMRHRSLVDEEVVA